MPLDEVDPFYDAEEERRAIEQGERNQAMRDRIRKKRKLDEIEVPKQGTIAVYMAIPCEVIKEAPWRRERLDKLNEFIALHEEIVEFVRWLEHSEEEKTKKEEFLEKVKEIVREVMDGECVVFGSWYTELSLPDSDLDVSIIATITEHEIVNNLKLLAEKLLEKKLIEYVEIREKARIPLLVIRQGDVEMDLTINVDTGAVGPLGTSEFISRGLRRFPMMKTMVLFLKVFLQQRALQDTFTGGVGSYLLSCMVLGFLQYRESRGGLREMSLGHLVFDFFTFYVKDLNTSREGVSVNGGGSRFLKADRRFEALGGPAARDRSGDLLCMESPLEPHIDIGGKAFQWRAVKQAFMQARLVIANAVQNKDVGGSIIAPGLIDPELFAGKLVDRSEPPSKRRRVQTVTEIPEHWRRSDKQRGHQHETVERSHHGRDRHHSHHEHRSHQGANHQGQSQRRQPSPPSRGHRFR